MFIWWLGLVALLNEEREKDKCPQVSTELQGVLRRAAEAAMRRH
jgi:hypothetical protein